MGCPIGNIAGTQRVLFYLPLHISYLEWQMKQRIWKSLFYCKYPANNNQQRDYEQAPQTKCSATATTTVVTFATEGRLCDHASGSGATTRNRDNTRASGWRDVAQVSDIDGASARAEWR